MIKKLQFAILAVLLILPFSAMAHKSLKVKAADFLSIAPISTNGKNNQLFGPDKRIDFVISSEKAANILSAEVENLEISSFPVSPTQFEDVKLEARRSVVDANTIYWTKENGKLVRGKLPVINSYVGKIKNDEGSLVILNNINGEISGLVQHNDGTTYNIGKNQEETLRQGVYSLILSNTSNLLETYGSTFCSTNTDAPSDEISELIANHKKNPDAQSAYFLQADVIIEANFELVMRFLRKKVPASIPPENVTEAQWQTANDDLLRYVLAVMTMTSRIYEQLVNVTLYVPQIDVYNLGLDFADPYEYLTDRDLREKLQAMPFIWSQKTDIPRAFVALFSDVSRQPAGSIILGIANRDQLCSPTSGFTVVGLNTTSNYPTFNFTTDVQVAAHEFGHVFGSEHTHSCSWAPAIDTCVVSGSPDNIGDACFASSQLRRRNNRGDIMSYCHYNGGIAYQFHPKVYGVIRGRAERVACVKPPTEPTIKLIRPIGRERSFSSGKKEAIIWGSSKVNQARIKFSANNGQTWTDVATVNPINDTLYVWTVPNTPTTQARIRIEDVADPNNVFDETDIIFEIKAQNININSHTNGVKIGYLKSLDLMWTKSLVDAVDVHVSLDGGENWKEFAKNITGTTTKIKLDEQASSNSKIRILASNDPDVYDEFSCNIGRETINILSPINDGYACVGTTKFVFWWDYDFIAPSELLRLEFRMNPQAEWTRIPALLLRAENAIWDKWVPNEPAVTVGEDAEFRILITDGSDLLEVSNIITSFNFVDCPLSVETISNDDRLSIQDISPNPASSKVQIRLNVSDAVNLPLKLMVVDLNGRVVFEKDGINAMPNAPSTIEIDVSNLVNGAYNITLSAGDIISTAKLMISK